MVREKAGAVLGELEMSDPFGEQVGGDHYKHFKIQPTEFIEANNLSFIEGSIVKYICRHRRKGKAEDIRKLIHYAELLLKLEYGEKENG